MADTSIHLPAITSTPAVPTVPALAERADQAARVLDRVLVPAARIVGRALLGLAVTALTAGAGAALAAWLGRDEDLVKIAGWVVAGFSGLVAGLAVLQRAAVRELEHVPGHVRALGADLPARVDEITRACEETRTGGVLRRAGAVVRVRSLCDELQGPFADWNVFARLTSPLRWTTLLGAAALMPLLLFVALPVLFVLAV